ncbi:uncharacterized protein LOC114542822 [Dendronephthya gigantea]|uniref:uncharacterized protein LOC114518632 n=1 Tax=Dendronephthya gigantea TaxID=151771 RepID=UPI00106B5D86|nr:uncharacterized protein LOC114518632 [Dendronephthya gigantea]XP_028418046.1 uncharacterized protein LOC114542822 [Dendronephthya gigantea]
MDMFERCLSKKELKMIAKNLKRNVIPYLRAGASSHAISSSEDMKIYLKSLDYGPVMSSNMVQSLFDAYLPVVNGIRIEDANTFLQDVLLPEAIVQVIRKAEGLNYFRAWLFYAKCKLHSCPQLNV